MRRASAILVAAAALLLVAGGETASPQGRIVIQGPATGTHLRLAASGSRLSIEGPTAALPPGCSRTRGHRVASCSLAGVDSIEVDTGPSGDKVEVLNPLPVPLTAYLGGGSDKMIGSGEPDTCYPQGSDRNRCIGGGGNDICISAPVNTDCVGGDGDDYCRTSSGSDGCWGGPGRDVCHMGEGQDGCHGEGGDDLLFGGPASDRLYGGSGFDSCDGEPGVGRIRECEADSDAASGRR